MAFNAPPSGERRSHTGSIRGGGSFRSARTPRSPMSSLRLVTRYADAMAERLEANAHKSGWWHMSVKRLLVRAEQELGELRRAIEADEPYGRIASEAADVGNFLAMLVAVREQEAREANALQDGE